MFALQYFTVFRAKIELNSSDLDQVCLKLGSGANPVIPKLLIIYLYYNIKEKDKRTIWKRLVKEMLTITEQAAEKVKEVIAQQHMGMAFLRLYVAGFG